MEPWAASEGAFTYFYYIFKVLYLFVTQGFILFCMTEQYMKHHFPSKDDVSS